MIDQSQAQAESVQKAILAQHSARHMKGPKQMLPNGIMVSSMPYIGFRHPGEVVGVMLGDPTSIMKKECVKPGHKYVWYSRRDIRTTTKLRAHVARAVTMDEIDTMNPAAQVIEIVTPTGSGVLWENMLLCELNPKWAERLYTDYERAAISYLAQFQEGFAPSIEDATKGAYTGAFEVRDQAVGR